MEYTRNSYNFLHFLSIYLSFSFLFVSFSRITIKFQLQKLRRINLKISFYPTVLTLGIIVWKITNPKNDERYEYGSVRSIERSRSSQFSIFFLSFSIESYREIFRKRRVTNLQKKIVNLKNELANLSRIVILQTRHIAEMLF